MLVACVALGALAVGMTAAQSVEQTAPPFRIDPGLPTDIVVNAEQGLGQCHWIDTAVLGSPLVSWAYDARQAGSGWSTLEPQPGVFAWAPMDAQVGKARSLNRRIWLQLLTTEGSTPVWAQEAGVPLVGSRGGTPAPWDPTYQQLLRRAVHAMAARYDQDPTVDAIIVMAGGCYGEMAICAPEADRQAWEKAGYSDARFIEAVKQIVDIYLEDEHLWEDGTRTRGFQHTPIVLQLGAGLYGHTSEVIVPVVEYAVAQYGMRVWLKYNGWGGRYDMGWLFEDYHALTTVGYEPMGNSPDFEEQPKEYVRAALDQHASFVCLQRSYHDIDNAEWEEAREMAARYLGAQIVHLGTEAPASVSPGEEYSFVTEWANRGTTPLKRPQRIEGKDVPASYDVVIALVDPGSGVTVFEHCFSPAVPTMQWHAAQQVRTEQMLTIPHAVPMGTYDLRIGLLDPNAPAQDRPRYFRLINAGPEDGAGRHTVGTITVLQPSVSTGTPTVHAEPTPSSSAEETGNRLTTLLRQIWEWLRNLIPRLRYFASRGEAAWRRA